MNLVRNYDLPFCYFTVTAVPPKGELQCMYVFMECCMNLVRNYDLPFCYFTVTAVPPKGELQCMCVIIIPSCNWCHSIMHL